MIGHKNKAGKDTRRIMGSDDGKKEKRDPIRAGSRRITVSGRRWRLSGRMANPDLVKMRETTFEDHGAVQKDHDYPWSSYAMCATDDTR